MHRSGLGILCLIVLILSAIYVFAEPNAPLESNHAAAEKETALCIPLAISPLKPPEGVTSRRAFVVFPHALHFTYTCQTCHHKWQGEADIRSCMASGCHEKKSKTGEKAAFYYKYYKDAYHRKCRGCHMGIKNSNRALSKTRTDPKTKIMKTGPTGCVECHPKR